MTFHRILVPTDFSPAAEAAWALARRLAADSAARLILLHTPVEAPLFSEDMRSARRTARVYEASRRWARQQLDRRVAEAAAAGLQARAVMQSGQPWRVIVDRARAERADLIVIGTRGLGGIQRAFLGSVADRVIRLAACPVLTVHEPA